MLIVLSVPTFFTEYIPRPYNWLVKLSTLSIRDILPIVVLCFLYPKNKIFKWYAIVSCLLIVQSVSDCGVLWKLIRDYSFINPAEKNTIETVIDLSLAGIMAVNYILIFFTILFKFKKELRQEN